MSLFRQTLNYYACRMDHDLIQSTFKKIKDKITSRCCNHLFAKSFLKNETIDQDYKILECACSDFYSAHYFLTRCLGDSNLVHN